MLLIILLCGLRSLSARRAWIEIPTFFSLLFLCLVALRKESVDRNMLSLSSPVAVGSSLSARRAWIEILLVYLALIRYLVALRKESVDRNSKIAKKVLTSMCRSPQGERG